MIKSDIVKMELTTDNTKIEQTLLEMGIDPLRWAIVDIKGEELSISVSYES